MYFILYIAVTLLVKVAGNHLDLNSCENVLKYHKVPDAANFVIDSENHPFKVTGKLSIE